MPHEDLFAFALGTNARMAQVTADFAMDEDLDPRSRIAAAAVASKITTATANILRTMNDIETQQLAWAERVLAKAAAHPTLAGDGEIETLKVQRATAIKERLGLPYTDPDW